MPKQLVVTFIICSYNRAEYLDDTLQSLHEHAPSEGPNYELLVVDNNSTDQTSEVTQKYQTSSGKNDNAVCYIKETTQGLSHARNRGIEEANAPNVVFLDDDIQATPSLIPAWCSFFVDHPDAVAAGGKNHIQFDAPRPRWMSYFLLPLLAYHDLGNTMKTYPINKYPFGCNMGFKKSIFDRVGDFNIELGRKGKSLNAGEEKEIFKRIQELGKDIYYLPDAFLYHRVGAERLTIDYVRRQALGLGRSMKLRMADASTGQFINNWMQEIGKLLASVPLGIFYLLSLNPPRAAMLFKFRWWIWKGYQEKNPK
jgi:glycosyltransferase involved in cell wall biosynthesis